MNLNPLEILLSLINMLFVATPLLTPVVQVDLPTATSNSINETQHKPLVVTVDRHGKYYLGTTCSTKAPVSEKNLRLRIKQTVAAKQNAPWLVCGDINAPYQNVVKAMALFQAEGATNVGLVTYGSKN